MYPPQADCRRFCTASIDVNLDRSVPCFMQLPENWFESHHVWFYLAMLLDESSAMALLLHIGIDARLFLADSKQREANGSYDISRTSWVDLETI